MFSHDSLEGMVDTDEMSHAVASLPPIAVEAHPPVQPRQWPSNALARATGASAHLGSACRPPALTRAGGSPTMSVVTRRRRQARGAAHFALWGTPYALSVGHGPMPAVLVKNGGGSLGRDH